MRDRHTKSINAPLNELTGIVLDILRKRHPEIPSHSLTSPTVRVRISTDFNGVHRVDVWWEQE